MPPSNTPSPDSVFSDSSVHTGYAPVNGLKLYYEIHGPARPGQVPLVLLHGGGDTIETSFAKLLPILARTRQIIAFEQQGYGHTADILDRPFSFAQSADDTAALLQHLGIPQADFLGFSNGGTIALQLSIRHPHTVRRLVLASAVFRRDGVIPQLWDLMRDARLENMPAELQDAYLRVAPHPENLRLFHDKAAQRMREFCDLPDAAIRAIAAPALIVSGDVDIVLPEHSIALYRLLPHAQLAILPATNHGELTSRDALAPMVESFLNAAALP
ncbi:alpha/beta fold hydrolase [Opitutus sp. ER46]|uniref:alpha/beta fold hydrolase n=1 Tax=Opitutus sp. ER46 TaxID=2161864 RepID=UPI000D319DBB|nr:alpha/beta fold hydrolase [Opitutus sp. ER46]PTX96585.1 alpha/beta hydrolase [Opitutus sp. ER46]